MGALAVGRGRDDVRASSGDVAPLPPPPVDVTADETDADDAESDTDDDGNGGDDIADDNGGEVDAETHDADDDGGGDDVGSGGDTDVGGGDVARVVVATSTPLGADFFVTILTIARELTNERWFVWLHVDAQT